MLARSLSYCVVDAFTTKAFCGNAAAVIELSSDSDLKDSTLQLIAREFNLSATVFLQKNEDVQDTYSIRWFAATQELPLCGHGTLAAAHWLFSTRHVTLRSLRLKSKTAGVLTVDKVESGRIAFSLPIAREPRQLLGDDLRAHQKTWLAACPSLEGAKFVQCHTVASGTIALIDLPADQALKDLEVDASKLIDLPGILQILTTRAPAQNDHDFHQRVFQPKIGIAEDPCCGSAHCALVPLWSAINAEAGGLDSKTWYSSFAASARTGEVLASLDGERVKLQGYAVIVASGTLTFST